MQHLPARPASDDKPGRFQQAQVLHDPGPGHVHLGLEFAQGAAVPLEEKVEQESARRVRVHFEDEGVIHKRRHT